MPSQESDQLNVLRRAFPFFFACDEKLCLVHIGERLHSLCPEMKIGSLLTDSMTVERPEGLSNFEQIVSRSGDVFLLSLLSGLGLRLRGQFFTSKDSGEATIYFLGHPWITDIEELQHHSLDLSDFPPHAGIADMLILLQARNNGLVESRRLTQQLRDLTGKLEAQNKQLQRELEEREKLEQTIVQAQKMEAIGQLAGGIAHDFNNILTAVRGFGSLALEGLKSDDPRAMHIRHILDAGERATELTSRLLTFGRGQPLQFCCVNLIEAIEELDQILQPLLGEQIDLQIERRPGAGSTWADDASLQQVLLNLCLNARDAMSDKGVISVRYYGHEIKEVATATTGLIPPGHWQVIEVEDYGCGMDEETLDQIFEPFFTSKEPGKGTGLGLSTVWWILQRTKGALDVQSKIGEGTKFTIYLPQMATVQNDPKLTVQKSKAIEMGHVLLVEDEALVRQSVQAMLETVGWCVTPASNAEEALEIFDQNASEFDIVLTDLVMPNLGGRDLAHLLWQRSPQFPVLYMTGYDPESEGGKADAAEHIILKPFGPSELSDALKETLA
ncbi:MAG: ATP-binding protein [Phycisphaerales bacterium]|nr:ATP-binding protein [Phycisphaerales bacterium]